MKSRGDELLHFCRGVIRLTVPGLEGVKLVMDLEFFVLKKKKKGLWFLGCKLQECKYLSQEEYLVNNMAYET